MQLVLPWLTKRVAKALRSAKAPSHLQVGTEIFPLTIARHRKARRYILRMTPDGGLRLTVPRGASLDAGLTLARKQAGWIARERARRGVAAQPWVDGTRVWFRGARTPLIVDPHGVILGHDRIAVRDGLALRDAIEAHLRALATTELPDRCREFAALHGLAPTRITVRNQRSRWGSCSTRGAIALNWRLLQRPSSVSDYVILHELMHMRQPNHSRQFWREVASVCDGWREAERWLRQHGRELL